MTEFYYKKISEDEVDPQKVDETRRVLRHCERILSNLPNIKIQWCKETDEASYGFDNGLVRLQSILTRLAGNSSKVDRRYYKEDGLFIGQCYRLTASKEKARTVWLRADIPIDQIGLTVAHECFHLHEFGPHGKYRPPLTKKEMEVAEKKADSFAREVMQRLK